MYSKQLNKVKIVYIGEIESINLEIILKSHARLVRNKIKYVLLGNIVEIKKYFLKLKSKIQILEIFEINKLVNLSSKKIFVLNCGTINFHKSKKILNEIKIANRLANNHTNTLITMPINKSIIKKDFRFNGVTEYLEKINKTKTYMLMRGENFSIIPLTTHIELKNVLKKFSRNKIFNDFVNILEILKNSHLRYSKISFLGINPHAGENGTLGREDEIIKRIIYKLKKKYKSILIDGPLPSDSAFNKYNKKQLFISYYHDQALIPFKILNRKSINHTIGLSYRRLSPTHGTARDIIFKNKADNKSYIECMLS